MDAAANPVLVTGTRSGVVETRYRGAAVLVGNDGEILWSAGDPSLIAYPRSAIKYVQVLPVLMSAAVQAYGFSDAEIAVMCASHNAEPQHLETVRSILRKAGLPESALGCGAHNPLGVPAWEALLRQGGTVCDLHNNCSGKHAGFLAMAQHSGLPLDSYLHPDHPLQVAIRHEICHFAGITEADLHPGTDGCSAPNYAMPLVAMARMFRSLAVPQQDAAREAARAQVWRAVQAYPFQVAGTGRYCTDLMTAVPGQFLAKLGAEGFYAVSLRERGWGLAVKIEDGSTGPQYNLVQAILETLGLIPGSAAPLLQAYRRTPLLTAKGAVIGWRETDPSCLEGLKRLR